MGKKDQHKKDFKQFFQKFLKSKIEDSIIEYIINNSNLPGRRANLEMAFAFGECISEIPNIFFSLVWSLLEKLTELSDKDAPNNTPQEFLSFCGTIGLGSIIKVNENYFDKILFKLKKLARDSRWRMREAVRMALWRITRYHPEKILKILQTWIKGGDWLEIRAVAAGLADPELLKNKSIANKVLHIFKNMFNEILKTSLVERKKDSFKIMKKGLGYCLSVVVSNIPEVGFEFMEELALNNDNDINWILKENLKKNRLTKNHPIILGLLLLMMGE